MHVNSAHRSEITMTTEHCTHGNHIPSERPSGRRSVLLGASALAAPAVWQSKLAAAAEPVRIGMPIGLSGANSVVAPSVVQAAQLAIAEINGAGGVIGRQLELMVADDGSGADGAVKA